jgi:hypothetical protein
MVEPGTILLRRPELLPAPQKSPLEFLCDLETVETTTEPARAIRLWGLPIPARRARPRGGPPRHRPAPVGRRDRDLDQTIAATTRASSVPAGVSA